MQSDDLGIAEAMRACFEQHGRSYFCPAKPVGMATGQSQAPPTPAAASVAACSTQPLPSETCWSAQGWHEPCLLPVPSDREVFCQQQGLPVYQTLLYRTACAAHDLPAF